MCRWIPLVCHVFPRQGTFPELPCLFGDTLTRINPAYPDVLNENILLQHTHTHSGLLQPPQPQLFEFLSPLVELAA